MAYWIKPIGSKDIRIDKNEIWSTKFQEQHFHKKPIGIHTEDILITYAVGHQLIEGVYKVIGNTFREATEEQKKSKSWRKRYPHIWDTQNLLENFSQNWAANNLNLFDLEKIILAKGERVTPTPANSLDYIRRGPDKIRITEQFAQFIINEMNKKVPKHERLYLIT